MTKNKILGILGLANTQQEHESRATKQPQQDITVWWPMIAGYGGAKAPTEPKPAYAPTRESVISLMRASLVNGKLVTTVEELAEINGPEKERDDSFKIQTAAQKTELRLINQIPEKSERLTSVIWGLKAELFKALHELYPKTQSQSVRSSIRANIPSIHKALQAYFQLVKLGEYKHLTDKEHASILSLLDYI